MKKQDLTGCRFGLLTVIDEAPIYISPKGYRKTMWNCRCDCGNKCVVMGSHLLSGHTESCGCQKFRGLTSPIAKNLVGYKFGMLTVLYRQPNRMIGSNSRVVWHCKCDCGKETDVLSLLLTGGYIKSCGCLFISHAERTMIDYLASRNIEFDTQYHPDNLIGIGGGYLRFDFVIFRNHDIQCFIELDGEQHYHSVDYFGGTFKYEQLCANDNIKNTYCRTYDIDLIRIDVSKCRCEESFVQMYDRVLKKYLL